MNRLPPLPRTPRFTAFAFALTMTFAMLSGIGALADVPAPASALLVAAPAAPAQG